jgi:DnaJ-class molecular chaperone
MTDEDAFRLLGLEPGASPAEVRAAYRHKAKAAHPDAGGDAEAFEELWEAHAHALTYAEFERCPACCGTGKHLIMPQGGWRSISLACERCGGTGLRHK